MTNQAELTLIEGTATDPGPSGGDPLIGQTIDSRYFIEQVLGEGGMGLVYLARHTILGKNVAIKVLRPDVSRDKEIMQRFRQEAQSSSEIANEHIIDISDFGALPDGSTYFVMEYLDGRDLTHVIDHESPIPQDLIVHVAKQLCRALGAAHNIGIVHRDLKPDNIYLITRQGDPNFIKVLDFGIAKVGGSSSKLTKAGQVFGTPHYMSPEQCSGSGVDNRTDIYALGIIMYEMATGDVPFEAENLMGVLTKHLYEQPPAPSQVRQNLNEDLELIIMKCIAKTPDDRYETMGHLLADLDRLLMGEMTVARETQALPALDLPVPQSKTKYIVGALAAVAILFSLGGVAYWQSSQGPDEIVNEPLVETNAPPEELVGQVGGGATGAGAEAVEEPVEPVQPEVARSENITITSTPSGARAYVGNEQVGQTPLQVRRPTTGELEVRLESRGYRPRKTTLTETSDDEVSVRLLRRPRRQGMRGSSAEGSGMRRRPGNEVLTPAGW